MNINMHYRLIFFFFFTILPAFMFGTDYYWVGGSGNWTDINHWAKTSGGSVKHIQTPTPSDNVFFDANSATSDFTVNMSIPTAVCKSLDFTGLTKKLTLSGMCSEIRIFGSLKLSKKVDWNIQAKFSFEAQKAGNVISSNHCEMPFDIYFLSTGGSWMLTDSLHSAKNIIHKAGNFNTNGQKVSIFQYQSNSLLMRLLTLGSSHFYTNSVIVSGQGFSVNAGTSKIFILAQTFSIMSNGNHTFYDVRFVDCNAIIQSPGKLYFHNVWMEKDGTVNNSAEYNILYLTKGCSYLFSPNTTHTFITDLVATGDCKRLINIGGKGVTAIFKKTSGTIDIYFINLRGIVATGGATFNAWSSYDLGGNSGWNIQTPPKRTLYWVGGSGVWNDSIHWSLNSGGTGGECIPTIIDDVIFDNNSFQGNYHVVKVKDSAGNCHDMLWNTTKNPIFKGSTSKSLKISGSMWFCQSMTNSFEGIIKFVSNDLGEVIQTSNHTLHGNVDFDGRGSWTLLDSLKTNLQLSVTMGKLYSNNKYIRCKTFYLGTDKWKEIYLTSSRVDVTNGIMGIRQDSTYINPGTSVIHLYSKSTFLKTTHYPQRRLWTVIFEEDSLLTYSKFMPVNTRFHKIIYRGNVEKTGHLTVDSIFYSAGYDYVFEGKDTIIDYLRAHGYCTKKITFRTTNPMVPAFMYKASGVVNVTRVHMREMVALGNAVFTGYNSSDLGHNVNWNFQNVITNLYWVGDSGKWNDSLNWSYSSGGSGGACIPTINDNVFFDQNSFTGTNSMVLAESPNIFCRDMTWNPVLPNPVFKTQKSNMFIAGSMELSKNMSFAFKGDIFFCDTTKGKHILSSQQEFMQNILFIDTGSWVQYDSLMVKETIYLMEGHFSTDSNYLKMRNFNAFNNRTKSFDISGSEVVMNGVASPSTWYWSQYPNAVFKAAKSEVFFKNGKNLLNLSGNGNVTFNNIYFVPDNSNAVFTAAGNVINFNNKVYFGSSGNIFGDHQYDTLIFTRNHFYQLAKGKYQKVYKLFKADGDCNRKITIQGNGGVAFIEKNQGVVNVHEVLIKQIEAKGTATFNAYGGKDLGGNINWNFYPNAPRTLYWVNGNGDWSDTLHWSLQSGGPGGECIPTYIDEVIIDNLSSSTKTFSTLQLSSSGECHNLWWKAFSGTNFTGHIDIYGGMNIDKKINTSSLSVSFNAVSNSNVIKTGNNTLEMVLFNGRGGWKLQDSLVVADSIRFNCGYLKTNGNFISALSFGSLSNSKKRLDLGNSLIKLKSYWNMNNDSLTLNAGTSEILFEGGGNYTFRNEGKKSSYYYNLSVLDEMKGLTTFINRDTAVVFFNKVKVFNDGDFLNQFIFDSLIFAPGNTYRFQEGLQQVINKYWFIRGNNCYAINLQSTKMYNTAYAFKFSGIVEGDFINMRDIHAKGGCNFYAGLFSTDIDNNKNWVFVNGPNYVYGLGPDTNFTIGQNLVITTTNFNGTSSTLYNWSTGSTHDTIVVNKTGWYWVTVTYSSNCEIVDSIYVGCRVNLNYNVTDAKCYGDTNGAITVIIPDTNYVYSYQWSTGDTLQTVQPYPAGVYTITVTADSGKCQIVDTVAINQPPKVTIPQGDTAFCTGDSVLLDIGYFKKYYWADGYSKRQRWVSKPDTFFLYVENFKGCKSFGDTIKVRRDTMPVINLGDDTVICLGQTIQLIPTQGYSGYLWNNGSTDSIMEISLPGVFWVMVSNHTCYSYDTITVDNCPPELTLPNVFTPNGDGYNDYFVPQEKNILDFDMKIYNRWGMRIYHTKDLEHGWDGTYMNQPADDGVYFFVIEYREWLGLEASEIKRAQGTVTLLRNSR